MHIYTCMVRALIIFSLCNFNCCNGKCYTLANAHAAFICPSKLSLVITLILYLCNMQSIQHVNVYAIMYIILHLSVNLYVSAYRQYSLRNIQYKVMCGALDV